MSIAISPQEYREEAIRLFKELLNMARGTCFEEPVKRRLSMMTSYTIKIAVTAKAGDQS